MFLCKFNSSEYENQKTNDFFIGPLYTNYTRALNTYSIILPN